MKTVLPGRLMILTALVAPGRVACQDTLHLGVPVPRLADIRLQVDTGRIRGQLLELRADTLLLRRHRATTAHGAVYDSTRVRLDDVTALWVRQGDHMKKGAAIGAIVGAAFGLAFLLVPCDGCDETGAQMAAFLAPAFALLGGVVGGVIGSQTTRWKPMPWPP
jgi:hypothetical protein